MSKFTIYRLGDPRPDRMDVEFWSGQSIAFKLEVTEKLRREWAKFTLNRDSNGTVEGFRTVLRITQRP